MGFKMPPPQPPAATAPSRGPRGTPRSAAPPAASPVEAAPAPSRRRRTPPAASELGTGAVSPASSVVGSAVGPSGSAASGKGSRKKARPAPETGAPGSSSSLALAAPGMLASVVPDSSVNLVTNPNLCCGICLRRADDTSVDWPNNYNESNQMVRVGAACSIHWRSWAVAWRDRYATFSSFCIAYHNTPEERIKIDLSCRVDAKELLPGFNPKAIEVKVQSGYNITHNFECVDEEAWSRISVPGITPSLSSAAEADLKNLRTGAAHSGVFARSSRKPFLEISTFTRVFHETATSHLRIDDHVDPAQGGGLEWTSRTRDPRISQ